MATSTQLKSLITFETTRVWEFNRQILINDGSFNVNTRQPELLTDALAHDTGFESRIEHKPTGAAPEENKWLDLKPSDDLQ